MESRPGDYFELIVLLSDATRVDAVARWMAERGFQVTRMLSGVMLLGARTQIERTFSTSLADAALPRDLTVPEDLKDSVNSIVIRKPPTFGGRI